MSEANDDNLRRLVGMLADALWRARKEVLDAATICTLTGFDATLAELRSTAADLETATQKAHDWLHANSVIPVKYEDRSAAT